MKGSNANPQKHKPKKGSNKTKKQQPNKEWKQRQQQKTGNRSNKHKQKTTATNKQQTQNNEEGKQTSQNKNKEGVFRRMLHPTMAFAPSCKVKHVTLLQLSRCLPKFPLMHSSIIIRLDALEGSRMRLLIWKV